MKEARVRITAIGIENLKNVNHGEIRIPTSDEHSNASITAIFGQNGSGKTAVINALDILKTLLMGKSLPPSHGNLISLGKEKAHLMFEFVIEDADISERIRALYSFDLRVRDNQEDSFLSVGNESLKAAYESPEHTLRMQDILKTRFSEPIAPIAKVRTLLEQTSSTDRIVEQKLAEKESRSFLFSPWMNSVLRTGTVQSKSVSYWMKKLILRLSDYGARELFVITTRHSGYLSLGYLPISFRISNQDGEYFGCSVFRLEDSFELSRDLIDVYQKITEELNMVLEEIVPGLSLSLIILDTYLNQAGDAVCKVQLVSLKNGKNLPLQYESEGIRKLISVLQLLICVYNQPSVMVAIDELDSGVFEYLLGELMKLLQNHGKGQLLFTSHNLRPLETLSKTSNVFTTTNPEHRYVRLKNIKEDNNIRRVYYRELIVQDQEEILYDSANTTALGLAFRKAGEMSR